MQDEVTTLMEENAERAAQHIYDRITFVRSRVKVEGDLVTTLDQEASHIGDTQ